MQTRTETITPAQARKMLEKNTDNRPIRETKVAALVVAIKEGHWALTHQGIAIAPSGRILDGQHRLFAIVTAGVPVTIQVSRDVDPETYRWMDGHAPRTMPDRLHILNDTISNKMVINIVTAYLKCVEVHHHDRVHPTMVEDCFLKMSEAFIRVANQFRERIPHLTLAPIGAAIAVYVFKHKHQGEQFLDSYLSGEGLSGGDPALTLREAARNGRIPKNRKHEQYWKTMYACLADQGGKKITYLGTASCDFLANEYKSLQWERKEKGIKAAATRGKNQALRVG